MLVEIRKWLTLWWRGEMVGSEKGMGCTDGKRSSGSFPEVQKCSRSYWVMGTWHIQLSKLIDLNTSDLCILWYINYTLWQATSVMIPDSWYSHSYGVTSPGLCTGRSDSLSTNRYSKSEALSLLRWGYKKAVAFRCSLAVLASLAPYCELLYEEARMARNWWLWPTASKNLRPGSSYMSEFENSSSPSWALRGNHSPSWYFDCSLEWDPEPESPS